jgi:SOS-response transcriptional repressor LexA
MYADLTPRQQSVLDFIVAFQRQHRMAPTVREIGEHLGLSAPACIHRLLNVLKDKGYIVAEPGKKRSWRLARKISGSGIPLLGAVAAGVPIDAVENVEEELMDVYFLSVFPTFQHLPAAGPKDQYWILAMSKSRGRTLAISILPSLITASSA